MVANFYNYSKQSRDSGHVFLESYDAYTGVKKYIFLRVSILDTGTLHVNSFMYFVHTKIQVIHVSHFFFSLESVL